jgi:predicted metal-dependent peptidase
MNDAETLITKAVFRMLFAYRWFGNLIITMKRVRNDKIPTLATDSKNFYWNEQFVLDSAKIPGRLEFGVAHETWHAALNHPLESRRGRRDVMVRCGDMVTHLWQIACDYVVNGLCYETNAEYRRSAPNKQPIFDIPDWCFFDVKYLGMSAEQVYADLLKNLDDAPDGNKIIRGNGKGKMLFDHHFNKEEMKNRVSEAQANAQANVWKTTFQKQILIAQQTGKPLPGFVDTLAKIIFAPPKVSWRDELSTAVGDFFKTDMTFSPPSTRWLMRGMIMPSYKGSHLNAVIVVDTSGSQTRYLPKVYAELNHIFSTFNSYTLTIIEIDDQVRKVYTYQTGEDFTTHRPTGAGGFSTDFRPAFKYIEENVFDADIIVFSTDGYGAFPTQPPEKPVIWLATENTRPLKEYPFGRAIEMPDMDSNPDEL